jgi:hypothetical protein
MKKSIACLVILASFSIQACGKGGGPQRAEPLSGPRPAAARVQDQEAARIDSSQDELATLMSGLPTASETLKKWQESPSWKDFAKSINDHWTAFDTQILVPMKKWASEDLFEAGQATQSLLYPFGGPDFVTAFTLFPNATKIVLMGLEPVGNLPNFDKAPAGWGDDYFKDSDTILSDFLKRGYFVTKHMNEVYGAGRVDGALPVICFFLKRTGNSIVAVKRLALDDKGHWQESPYAAKRPQKWPYGIRVDYVKSADAVVRSVYYFTCDLSDTQFVKDGPLFEFFDGLEAMSTFIKSASYLLHYSEFANIRNLILTRSLVVLQDDSGVPYRYFKDRAWTIQLYGVYTTPVEDFSPRLEQKDLKAAYENPEGNVKKLPFHFGYHWVSKIDNLLLMKRSSAPSRNP